LEFKRFFFDRSGNRISPWHDIPLQPEGAAADVFNFICEIPKGWVAGWWNLSWHTLHTCDEGVCTHAQRWMSVS
jgi:hypothetical protein